MPLAGEDRVKLESLQEVVASELSAFEAEYEQQLSAELPLLNEICQHLKRGRSKRFRPTLLLVTAKDRGGSSAEVIFAATVVEIIHTATLIHDDFIDEAEVRRRLPTVNVKWGASAALIMGDYLYSKAFAQLTARGMLEPMNILARTTHEMSIAEMMQLERRRRLDVSEEDYFAIIHQKTASLIQASCEIGALLNRGINGQRDRFADFGLNIGLAFQIIDDMFDYLGDQRRLGKPVGSDWREGRITLPFISAWRNAPPRESERLRDALATLVDGSALWPDVRRFVEHHGGLDYAYQKARQFGRQAKECLVGISIQPQRDILAAAVDYVLGRVD